MSEKSGTFVGVNEEMRSRLAYAEIACLKDEVATANRGHIDLVSHDNALRTDFDRQREFDREFYKSLMDDLKSFYMQQMKELVNRHKSELRQLREENRENVRRIMQEYNDHQKASDNLIASLNLKIAALTEMLWKSQLSENKAKWLTRYCNGQRYKRAEQKRLLKSGHELTREEEKEEWPDKNGVNDPSTPVSVDDRLSPKKKNIAD